MSVADVCQVFVVTVDTKTPNHSYYNQGSSKAYLIDGKENTDIELEVGCTYVFDQSDDSNTGHPLGLYRDPAKMSEHTVGVSIDADGTLTITVTEDTPSRLYYQCKNHQYMGSGVIKVGSGLGATQGCAGGWGGRAYGQISSVTKGLTCDACTIKCGNDGALWSFEYDDPEPYFQQLGTCTCFVDDGSTFWLPQDTTCNSTKWTPGGGGTTIVSAFAMTKDPWVGYWFYQFGGRCKLSDGESYANPGATFTCPPQQGPNKDMGVAGMVPLMKIWNKFATKSPKGAAAVLPPPATVGAKGALGTTTFFLGSGSQASLTGGVLWTESNKAGQNTSPPGWAGVDPGLSDDHGWMTFNCKTTKTGQSDGARTACGGSNASMHCMYGGWCTGQTLCKPGEMNCDALWGDSQPARPTQAGIAPKLSPGVTKKVINFGGWGDCGKRGPGAGSSDDGCGTPEDDGNSKCCSAADGNVWPPIPLKHSYCWGTSNTPDKVSADPKTGHLGGPNVVWYPEIVPQQPCPAKIIAWAQGVDEVPADSYNALKGESEWGAQGATTLTGAGKGKLAVSIDIEGVIKNASKTSSGNPNTDLEKPLTELFQGYKNAGIKTILTMPGFGVAAAFGGMDWFTQKLMDQVDYVCLMYYQHINDTQCLSQFDASGCTYCVNDQGKPIDSEKGFGPDGNKEPCGAMTKKMLIASLRQWLSTNKNKSDTTYNSGDVVLASPGNPAHHRTQCPQDVSLAIKNSDGGLGGEMCGASKLLLGLSMGEPAPNGDYEFLSAKHTGTDGIEKGPWYWENWIDAIMSSTWGEGDLHSPDEMSPNNTKIAGTQLIGGLAGFTQWALPSSANQTTATYCDVCSCPGAREVTYQGPGPSQNGQPGGKPILLPDGSTDCAKMCRSSKPPEGSSAQQLCPGQTCTVPLGQCSNPTTNLGATPSDPGITVVPPANNPTPGWGYY